MTYYHYNELPPNDRQFIDEKIINMVQWGEKCVHENGAVSCELTITMPAYLNSLALLSPLLKLEHNENAQFNYVQVLPGHNAVKSIRFSDVDKVRLSYK